jgi:tRNA threonylcarbamoyladenosine biosynthesis protein TsaB
LILAINTSTIQFGVSIVKEDGAILSEYLLHPGKGNFGMLMPAVDAMFQFSHGEVGEIRAVVVAKGPGSFTGMRIGLAMAKGMAQSLGVPLIGVSSLEAMAHQLAFTNHPICPLIDSRRGDVFTALFRWSEGNQIIRLQEDCCLRYEDFPSFIEKETIFVGNNQNNQVHLISELLGEKALFAPGHFWHLRSSTLGQLGLIRYAHGDFDDVRDLVPTYLRPPDIRPTRAREILSQDNAVDK